MKTPPQRRKLVGQRRTEAIEARDRHQRELAELERQIEARRQAIAETDANLAALQDEANEVEAYARAQGLSPSLAEAELRKKAIEADDSPRDVMAMTPAEFRIYKSKMHGLGQG